MKDFFISMNVFENESVSVFLWPVRCNILWELRESKDLKKKLITFNQYILLLVFFVSFHSNSPWEVVKMLLIVREINSKCFTVIIFWYLNKYLAFCLILFCEIHQSGISHILSKTMLLCCWLWGGGAWIYKSEVVSFLNHVSLKYLCTFSLVWCWNGLKVNVCDTGVIFHVTVSCDLWSLFVLALFVLHASRWVYFNKALFKRLYFMVCFFVFSEFGA